jgi:hypothetical protein
MAGRMEMSDFCGWKGIFLARCFLPEQQKADSSTPLRSGRNDNFSMDFLMREGPTA